MPGDVDEADRGSAPTVPEMQIAILGHQAWRTADGPAQGEDGKDAREPGQEREGSAGVRAAIYARVSTADQTCALQLKELRTWVKARGWKAAGEYVDTGWSGAKTSRPELNRLMQDALERKVDVILVWKLDRWGRSVSHLITSLQELRRLGVRWMATTQGLDTDEASPVGQLLMHILSSVAEFERALAQERIKAGLAAAMARGVKVGRPCKVFRRDRALELRAEGWSLRAIARELRVPVMTVHRAVPSTAPNPHPQAVPKPRKLKPLKTGQTKAKR